MNDTKTLEYKRSLKKRMALMIISLLFVFGGIFGWDAIHIYLGFKTFEHFKLPPVAVSSEDVKEQDWQPHIEAVGDLVAKNGVDVSTETAGIIQTIDFKSGQHVEQGQTLVQLNDRVDEQDLKNNVAELKLSQMDFERQSTLYEKRSTPKLSLDQAQARLAKAQAMVAKSMAVVAQKHIKAPFSGRVGIRAINIGQYVAPGTVLVNLQSLNPMYVRFTIPSQQLPRIRRGQTIVITVDAYPNQTFTGKISAINAAVSKNTGNILVEATLPNDDEKLLPGLFAKVSILLPKLKNVLTVPETAITYTLYGDSVYLIQKKDNALLAHRQNITVGEARNGRVMLLKGVKKGDQVVTTGQLKLRDGAEVKINNTVQLKSSDQATTLW